ncbi:MAG: ribonuclease P protein component [Chloroflexota bacterium]
MRRASRLRRPADFERVRSARRSWANALLVLYVADNGGQPTRIGVTVGKRVGKAVVRNRVRRQVRECVRQDYDSIKAGRDLVFIARPSCAESGWSELRGAVLDLLGRGRVLTGNNANKGQDVRASRPGDGA